eukprot:6142363-Prymnesium_polylepis.1
MSGLTHDVVFACPNGSMILSFISLAYWATTPATTSHTATTPRVERFIANIRNRKSIGSGGEQWPSAALRCAANAQK